MSIESQKESFVNPTRGLLAIKLCMSIKKIDNIWYVNKYNGTDPEVVTDLVNIPFHVRTVKIGDVTESSYKKIKFDTLGIEGVSGFSTGVVEPFAPNVEHPVNMTKVYLSAETTAEEIYLHG